jgi:ABC-type transport system involved in multi-copper enzyme maturation permease subunit
LILHELELLLRTKRVLIFGALYLLVALLIGYGATKALSVAEQAAMEGSNLTAEQVREMAADAAEEHREELLSAVDLDEDALSPALLDAPIGMGYFLLSLWFLPGLILLFAYDAIGVNLARRTFCYTTFRAPRWAHVTAKWAALSLAVAAVVLLGGAIVLGVASSMLTTFPTDVAIRAWVRSSGALLLYSTAYVAFGVWCSTLARAPFRVLAIGSVLLFAMDLIRIDAIPLSQYLQHISLSHHRPALWATVEGGLGLGVLIYIAFTCAFIGLAAATFQRRDL